MPKTNNLGGLNWEAYELEIITEAIINNSHETNLKICNVVESKLKNRSRSAILNKIQAQYKRIFHKTKRQGNKSIQRLITSTVKSRTKLASVPVNNITPIVTPVITPTLAPILTSTSFKGVVIKVPVKEVVFEDNHLIFKL